MRSLFPLSLNVQLTCVVSVVLCSAILTYSWSASKKHEALNISTMRENAFIMARNLSDSCANSIVVNDYAGLEEFLLKTAELPNIRSIIVIEPNGKVLANIGRDGNSAEPKQLPFSFTMVPFGDEKGVSFQGQLMQVVQPIDAGSLLGWIKITYSTQQIEEMKSALLKSSLLMALAWSLTGSLILTIIIGRTLSGIKRVAEFARQLAANKGLEIKIRNNSREVELLSGSLNYASRKLHLNQQQLLAERERLSVTLHSIADGVIATDINGVVVLLNRVAADLIGWSMEESAGKPLAEIFTIIDQQQRQQAVNPVEKVLASRMPVMMSDHTILISRSGSEHNISSSGSPIIDREGNIIGVVLTFRDMTERYMLDAELTRIQKLNSLGVLAGGIAHDFNNILTAISGNITLAMMRAGEDDPVLEKLALAVKATERATGLSNQLLTFSRGGIPIMRKGSIPNLLTDTVSFSLRGSSVKPVFEIAHDLWKVEMDEGQISQVIQNLTINAQQAMPDGGIITIAATNHIKDEHEQLPLCAGPYVKIAVTDQGTGIPAEIMPMVFDPFFTTKATGNGLGLAICHSIASRHNGFLGVESIEGRGTSFTLYIPALIGEDSAPEETGATTHQLIPVSNSILIMDDDEHVLTVLAEMLEQLGYPVIPTTNGQEAVAQYRLRQENGEKIGLAILDLTVPGGMGGQEALAELKAINPEIKAFVTSGYSNDPVLAHHAAYGFLGMIKKPFTLKDVQGVLYSINS